MKKILLLSSILCIFLSACGSESVPATPISTLHPATPLPSPSPTIPPTESPTPTVEPTIAPTEGPAKVETLVEKIPFVSSDILFSQAFDEQIIEDEAAGKFPSNPNAKPLTSIDFRPAESDLMYREYGVSKIFGISKTDAQVFRNNYQKAWSLAKLVQTEIEGVKFMVAVVRWENQNKPDGTKTPAGFTKGIIFLSDSKIKDLILDEEFNRAFGSGPYLPSGSYWDSNRPEALKKYLAYFGANNTALFNFIKEQQDAVSKIRFWQKCEETGIINNEMLDANGVSNVVIPVLTLDSSAY